METFGVGAGVVVDVAGGGGAGAVGAVVEIDDVGLGCGEEGSAGDEEGCECFHGGSWLRWWWVAFGDLNFGWDGERGFWALVYESDGFLDLRVVEGLAITGAWCQYIYPPSW